MAPRSQILGNRCSGHWLLRTALVEPSGHSLETWSPPQQMETWWHGKETINHPLGGPRRMRSKFCLYEPVAE